MQRTFTLRFTPDDRATGSYRPMPFDVPEGIARLTVRYAFASLDDPTKTGKDSGSVIDLGLFDPRGHAFLDLPGFRGWSGSSRREVTVSAGEGTPGYLPGPIQQGTWHVLLGLYQIAPQGCEVQVTVELEPGEAVRAGDATFEPQGILETGTRWYRGDLHCHTHHSDGTADVATLVAVARAQGLDYLGVTEHNTVSHLPDLTRNATSDLLLIPAIEITTYRGHANVWGIRAMQEFRAETEEALWQVRERVCGQGLLFSINHPKDGGPPWEFEHAEDADAMEGWQAPWWLSNYQSLSFWDRLLQQGKRPTLVGGSDKHQGPFDGTLSAYELGTPTTWVYAPELSEPAILEGIRVGHVYVSKNPEGPHLAFTARAGEREVMMGDELHVARGEEILFRCRVDGAEEGWLLRVVHREGEALCVPIAGDEWAYTWEVSAAQDDYYRLEVIEPPLEPLEKEPSALFCFALSNPIYVRESLTP